MAGKRSNDLEDKELKTKGTETNKRVTPRRKTELPKRFRDDSSDGKVSNTEKGPPKKKKTSARKVKGKDSEVPTEESVQASKSKGNGKNVKEKLATKPMTTEAKSFDNSEHHTSHREELPPQPPKGIFPDLSQQPFPADSLAFQQPLSKTKTRNDPLTSTQKTQDDWSQSQPSQESFNHGQPIGSMSPDLFAEDPFSSIAAQQTAGDDYDSSTQYIEGTPRINTKTPKMPRSNQVEGKTDKGDAAAETIVHGYQKYPNETGTRQKEYLTPNSKIQRTPKEPLVLSPEQISRYIVRMSLQMTYLVKCMRTLRLDTTGKKQTSGLTNEASIVSGNHFRFPLRSLSDLKALESHLSSSASAKDEIIDELWLCGEDKSLVTSVQRTLKYIIGSDEIWLRYTLEGAKKKNDGFKSLQVYSCVRDAITRRFKDGKDFNFKSVDDIAGRFFTTNRYSANQRLSSAKKGKTSKKDGKKLDRKTMEDEDGEEEEIEEEEIEEEEVEEEEEIDEEVEEEEEEKGYSDDDYDTV